MEPSHIEHTDKRGRRGQGPLEKSVQSSKESEAPEALPTDFRAPPLVRLGAILQGKKLSQKTTGSHSSTISRFDQIISSEKALSVMERFSLYADLTLICTRLLKVANMKAHGSIISQMPQVMQVIVNNGGDFIWGNIGAELLFKAVPKKIHYGKELVALGVASYITLAETVLPQLFMYSTPDIWDIPAGLIGVGLAYCRSRGNQIYLNG